MFQHIAVASSSMVKLSKKAALVLLDPDRRTMIIETFGTGYPITRRHILTHVRYSAQIAV